MGDGFKIVPQRALAVSQAFGARQETPRQLARRLEQARAVDTGDSSLDGEVGDRMSQLTTLLGQFADCLRQDALGLELTVAAFQATDEDALDALGHIVDEMNAGRPGQPGRPTS